MITLSFITANYVGRATHYQGPADWGALDRATQAATSPCHLQAMADEVKAARFDGLDLWTAHCHWQAHGKTDLPERIAAICHRAKLPITSYAGGIEAKCPADVDAPFSLMKRLGAPVFAGGIWGVPDAELAPMVQAACDQHDLRWAFENHPQKTVEEIEAKFGAGRYPRCGVALDTGWCGIQGLDALEATKRLRENLFLVHLKDITAPGSHDTCAIGEGVVPCEAVVRHLIDTHWAGTLCLEHEPYTRDPMPELIRSLKRVREWLS